MNHWIIFSFLAVFWVICAFGAECPEQTKKDLSNAIGTTTEASLRIAFTATDLKASDLPLSVTQPIIKIWYYITPYDPNTAAISGSARNLTGDTNEFEEVFEISFKQGSHQKLRIQLCDTDDKELGDVFVSVKELVDTPLMVERNFVGEGLQNGKLVIYTMLNKVTSPDADDRLIFSVINSEKDKRVVKLRRTIYVDK